MANLLVQSVETRRQKKQFLELPWTLYRNDENWIPPMRTTIREMVGFKHHPFHDVADVKTWIATRDGQPCGRIAGIVNHVHNKKYDEKRGFWGFFESVDDQEVANGLFDAIRHWFEQQDIHLMRGPVNPSLNYEVGMLIDGFDSPATFMMTYNPPYYPTLVENYGFAKVQDLYAFWGHIEMLSKLDQKLGFIIREATRRFNLTLRFLDRRRFREEVRTFLNLYNASMDGTWGFTPLSEGEIDRLSGELRHLIIPELTSAIDVNGRTVAAAFALPDYNPRIRDIKGRLFPFGFIHLLTRRRKIKRIRLLSTNVMPEYQRWGLGLVVLARLVPEVLKWGIEEAEFSWVLESNHLSFKSLQRGGAKLTKSYRIYDWPAPDPAAESS